MNEKLDRMENYQYEPFMTTQRWMLVFIALILWLPSSAIAGQPPKPPLILPFAVQREGETVTTELRVVEHRYYLFFLYLWSKKNDPEDRNRVAGLAGAAVKGPDGKLSQSLGIPIPVRLTIIEISSAGERVLYDQATQNEQLIGWGDNFFTEIIVQHIELKPGLYRVSVKSLHNIPELVGTPVSFGIGHYPNTSSIH